MSEVTAALAQTVEGNHAQVKQASTFLSSKDKDPNFIKEILNIIISENTAGHVRHAASIYFKNYLRNYWPMNEDQEYTIPIDTCNDIKKNMVSLMLSTPTTIQRQIVDSFEIIAWTDFPEKWKEILPELIQLTGKSITEKQFNKTIDLLKATYTLLRRYGTLGDSSIVNKELAFILSHIANPLMEEFKIFDSMLSQTTNPNELKIVFQLLHQVYKIFYCLNYVTLPEIIEENLDFYMNFHLKHLSYQSKAEELLGDDDDKPGILLKVQSAICQNITIYIQKYDEEFGKHINAFIDAVWNLLTKLDLSLSKYDKLIASGLNVLTNVSKGIAHERLHQPEVLQQICEKIITPNLMFQEVDEINFEENHTEYIRTDLEDSNQLTKRYSACELVQGLRKHNESTVTKVFVGKLMTLLNEYSSNKNENWKKKDAAFFLITALTITGGTRVQGITRVNKEVPIGEFFEQQVIPEFQAYPNNNPVIQADTLKFCITFRNQIPKEAYNSIIQCATKMLTSSEYVVCTYAASCIERLLVVKDGNTFRFGANDLKPHLSSILKACFEKLSITKFENNDYIMRLVMRVLSVSKGDAIENINFIMQALQSILVRISKVPTIPAFDHYAFESVACLCLCLNASNPNLVAEFEKNILPTMSVILQSQVANFSPYVYQLLSMFLELNPTGTFNDSHKELLNHIIAPATWAETGNIPALTRLVQAYLKKDIKSIISMNMIGPILGIFQKLISSSAQDHHAFAILNVILQETPWETISTLIEAIFSLIFKRLTNKKTAKLCREFTLFICRFIHKYSLKVLNDIMDKISKGILNNVLGVWASALNTFNNFVDCQLSSIITSNCLCDPILVTPDYISNWSLLFNGIAKILLGSQKNNSIEEGHEDIFAETENSKLLGTQTSFIKLVHSVTPKTVDPLIQEVSKLNRTEYVGKKLREFILQNKQNLQGVLNEIQKNENGSELLKKLQIQ